MLCSRSVLMNGYNENVLRKGYFCMFQLQDVLDISTIETQFRVCQHRGRDTMPKMRIYKVNR